MPTKRPARRVSPAAKGAASKTSSDEAPAKKPAAKKPAAKKTVGGKGKKLRAGWGAGQATMDATSDFAQNFKPSANLQIIKFREDSPYVSYIRHWLDTSQGKRTYTCLQSVDEECPLCDVGVETQSVSAFNVTLVDDDGTLAQKSWDVGPRLFKQLKNFAEDPKIGPLSRFFFAVSKSGSGGTSTTNVIPVRPSTMEEEYDVPVPTDDELDAVPVYDESVVDIKDFDFLESLALEQE